MSNKPFASFCFSTYRRPSYLRSTLEKILLQTFTDFEVIVSDNDENESAKEIVNSFHDQRIKYFPNGENLGMKKSYNKSLERSSGSFITMIADDDPVYPDMLQTLYELQKEYPGYGMYLGGCDWFCTSYKVGKLYNFKVGTNSCLSQNHDLDYKQSFSSENFLEQLFSFGIFPHYLWSTCIIKREILIEKGGIPEYGTPFLGDYAYLSVMGSHSGCVIINRALGCQTLHEENFGRDQNEQLVIAAKNFPLYIQGKVSGLKNWPVIQNKMQRFVALWLISHLTFLHHYYKQTRKNEAGLRLAEKDVFGLEFIKKYKTKYLLKKHFPFFHDLLVKVKKLLRGQNET